MILRTSNEMKYRKNDTSPSNEKNIPTLTEIENNKVANKTKSHQNTYDQQNLHERRYFTLLEIKHTKQY